MRNEDHWTRIGDQIRGKRRHTILNRRGPCSIPKRGKEGRKSYEGYGIGLPPCSDRKLISSVQRIEETSTMQAFAITTVRIFRIFVSIAASLIRVPIRSGKFFGCDRFQRYIGSTRRKKKKKKKKENGRKNGLVCPSYAPPTTKYSRNEDCSSSEKTIRR